MTDVRDTNEEVASLFFKGKMREELMSVMVEVIGHEKFGANVSFMASRCMADDFSRTPSPKVSRRPWKTRASGNPSSL